MLKLVFWSSRSAVWSLPVSHESMNLFFLPSASYEARVLVFPKRRLESSCLSRTKLVFWSSRSAVWSIPVSHESMNLFFLPSASSYEARVLVFPKRRLESSCTSPTKLVFWSSRNAVWSLPVSHESMNLFFLPSASSYEARVLVFPKRSLEYSCLSRTKLVFWSSRSAVWSLPVSHESMSLFFLPSASSYEARVLVFPKRRLESSCTSRTNLVFWSSRNAVWSLPVSHESMNLFFLPSASSYEARVLVFPKRRLESSCLSRTKLVFWSSRSAVWSLPVSHESMNLFSCLLLLLTKLVFWSSRSAVWSLLVSHVRSSCFGLPEAPSGVFLSLASQ